MAHIRSQACKVTAGIYGSHIKEAWEALGSGIWVWGLGLRIPAWGLELRVPFLV